MAFISTNNIILNTLISLLPFLPPGEIRLQLSRAPINCPRRVRHRLVRYVINCSQTNFVVIILVPWSYVIFSWTAFSPDPFYFCPQKLDKQIGLGGK